MLSIQAIRVKRQELSRQRQRSTPSSLISTEQHQSTTLDAHGKNIYAAQQHLKRVLLMQMSISPSHGFKEALQAYHDCIQYQATRHLRHDFITVMKSCIQVCPPTDDCFYPLEQFVLALGFVKSHSASTLNDYEGLNHLSPDDEQCFKIEIELIEFIIDLCFSFYLKGKPDADHEGILLAHYYSVFRSSTLLFDGSVKLLNQLLTQTLSVQEQVARQLQIDRFLKKIGATIESFVLGTVQLKSTQTFFFHSDLSNLLFRQYLMSAQLQLICRNQENAAHILAVCEDYHNKIKLPSPLLQEYHNLKQEFDNLFVTKLPETVVIHDNDDAITPKSSLKKNKKKKKKSRVVTSTETVETLSVPHEEVVVLPPVLPEVKIPTLNPSAPSWIGQPIAYKHNPQLRLLLDEMSAIFKQSACNGFVFGSSITDDEPGDVDVLLPDIVTAEHRAHVNELIRLFIQSGGIVTAFTDRAYGYTKFNRHIIPLIWRDFKIELSITHKTYLEHAQSLDFTIRALYFNLRTLRLLSVDGIPALQDLNAQRIQTISHPAFSFRADPILIFRAVRLIAKGFRLSDESHAVISDMFSGEDNPFAMINVDKLCYHLSVLLEPRYCERSMDILMSLGLFFKLFECFNHHCFMDEKVSYYRQRLTPFYSKYFVYTEPSFIMTPYNFFQAPRRDGEQTMFYSAFPPPVPLMAWYPAST